MHRTCGKSVRDNRYTIMNKNYKRGYDCIKRVIDVVIASSALLILSPIFLLIMLLLKIETPEAKAIFRQERVGQNGKIFSVFKFRSLSENAPDNVPSHILCEDRFVTKIGKIMRVTGLDELPQLVNVALGDMSIVGPRPLIPEEGSIHEKRMKKGIYRLRPGITGLAQIHGGNSISDREKVFWDHQYLLKRSFFIDMAICAKTVFLSLSGRITPKQSVGKKQERNKHKIFAKYNGIIGD